MELFDAPKRDVPRTVSAGVVGVTTGLLGTVIPIIGLTGGFVVQLLEGESMTLRQGQYITEGVVDGSAALLARAFITGSALSGRGQVEEMSDADAMIG